MSYVYATQNEKTVSGALALVMHLLFLLLLVFGVNWQQHKQSDSAVIVDLWNNLPALPQPKPEPPPVAKAPPEPPKPAPRVEPKPEPKPVIKPDIALQEKHEKERKLKVEREKIEEKKREQEKVRLDALKEKRAKEAEAKRRAKEQDDAIRKVNEQQAAQAAAARGKQIDKYMGLIRDKIRRFVVEPPSLQGNPEVEFSVVVLPGGEVLSVKLKKGSASQAYDNAVERAILKAQPLPLPPDPSLFNDFRELNLKFRPKE